MPFKNQPVIIVYYYPLSNRSQRPGQDGRI